MEVKTSIKRDEEKLATTKSYLSVLYDSIVEVEVSGLIRFLCYNKDSKQRENENIENFLVDQLSYYDCFYYDEFTICDENGQVLNRYTNNNDGQFIAIHVTKSNDGNIINIIAEDATGIHVTNLIDINFNYSPMLKKEASKYPGVALGMEDCDEVDWDDILSDDEDDSIKASETWKSLDDNEKQLVYSGHSEDLQSLTGSSYQNFEIDSVIPLTDSGNILDLYLLKAEDKQSDYYEDGTFYHRVIKIKPDGWEDLYISIEKESKLVMNSQSYIADMKLWPSDNVVKTVIFTSSDYYIHIDNQTGEVLGRGYETNTPAFLQLLRPYVYGIDNKTGNFKISRYNSFGYIDENRSIIKYAGEKFNAAFSPYNGYMIFKDFGLYALQDAVEAGDDYTEYKEIRDTKGNYVRITSNTNQDFGIEDIDSILESGRSLMIDDKFMIYDGQGLYIMKVIHDKNNECMELKLLESIEITEDDRESADEPVVYISRNVMKTGDKTIYFDFGLKAEDNKVKLLKVKTDTDKIETEFVQCNRLASIGIETSDGTLLKSIIRIGDCIDFSSIGIQNEFSYNNIIRHGVLGMHVHGVEWALDRYLDDKIE